MLIWMRQHGKRVMKWFAIPLIFVFIALYGSSHIADRRQINRLTAVWVNGERVPYTLYQSANEDIQRYYSDSLVTPEKPQAQMALEQVIDQELARQLANELNLRSIDAEVVRAINQQMSGGQGVVNESFYRRFLVETGFETHENYKEFVRSRMNVQQGVNTVRSTALPSQVDMERALARQRETRQIELLVFNTTNFSSQIDTPTAELESFFNNHIERYRFPKRMKIDYLESKPEDFIKDATPDPEKMERWFRSQRENFRLPVERTVHVVTFPQANFRNQVVFTEEELRNYYNQNLAQYRDPEKFRARFVAYSVEVPDASIEAEMKAHPQDYVSPEDSVAARHILLRTPPDATEEQLASILDKITEIRSRIHSEEDFIKEAKANSDDKSNASEGGDLKYFTKGRMVPAFEQAAFAIPNATVSQPVLTQFGYHLIWVYARRQAGDPMDVKEARFKALPKIDANPLKEKARRELRRIKDGLAGAGLASATALTTLPVYETGWFGRGETPHPEAERDRFQFYQGLANLQVGQISEPVEGFADFFLIELIEKQDPRQQSYEEARAKVEAAYRNSKSGEVARRMAEEAANLVRSGSLEFSQIASKYGVPKEVTYSGLRSPQGTQRETNQTVDREIINRAFSTDPKKVEGPFETLMGPALLLMVSEDKERIPELSEVQAEVEEKYRRVIGEQLAHDKLWQVWVNLDKYNNDMREAAKAFGVEVKQSDYFKPGEPIPGFPANSVVSYIAANLRVVGASSTVVEDPPRNPQNPQPVRAYYYIRAATIEETRLPSFTEVKDKVKEDFILDKAAPLALEAANKALQEITQLVSSATAPLSASRTIDLAAFAKEKGYSFIGPATLRYGMDMPEIPGEKSAGTIIRTAFKMDPGKLSQVVPAIETVLEKDKVTERIHGYYIFQLIDVAQAAPTTASRSEAFRALTQRMQDAVIADWSQRARRQAKIEFNDEFFPKELQDAVIGEIKGP